MTMFWVFLATLVVVLLLYFQQHRSQKAHQAEKMEQIQKRMARIEAKKNQKESQ